MRPPAPQCLHPGSSGQLAVRYVAHMLWAANMCSVTAECDHYVHDDVAGSLVVCPARVAKTTSSVCNTLCQLSAPVLAQALVSGDAAADKELCVRAMGAIYSAHAGVVGVLYELLRVGA